MLGVLGVCCGMLPRTDVMLIMLIVLLVVGCVLGIFAALIGRAFVNGTLLGLKLVPFVAVLLGRLVAGRIAHRPSLACIWDGCDEVGTFDHIAWTCPRRPDVHSVAACPALALSARWGWVVKGAGTDYGALHRWLETVQSRLWVVFHQQLGCCSPLAVAAFPPGFWFLLLFYLSVASYVTENLLKFFACALPVWGYLHLKIIQCGVVAVYWRGGIAVVYVRGVDVLVLVYVSGVGAVGYLVRHTRALWC